MFIIFQKFHLVYLRMEKFHRLLFLFFLIREVVWIYLNILTLKLLYEIFLILIKILLKVNFQKISKNFIIYAYMMYSLIRLKLLDWYSYICYMWVVKILYRKKV
mmetsp:Transcript_8399/g.727  ORF Transcript_8399/g.727 Transcript_8399/m.727 type:complete len:104 (+) Transcript_8399:171-482(+)